MNFVTEVLTKIMQGSGFAALDWKTALMLFIACVLLYMGIGKGFEPLLLVPIAFGMLGLSGFFHKRSDGLIPGYIVGVFGRLVCSVLSGVIFFAEYAEGTGLSPFAYSLAYNLAYMGGEAMLTCVLLILPPVRNAIGYIRRFVLSE